MPTIWHVKVPNVEFNPKILPKKGEKYDARNGGKDMASQELTVNNDSNTEISGNHRTAREVKCIKDIQLCNRVQFLTQFHT